MKTRLPLVIVAILIVGSVVAQFLEEDPPAVQAPKTAAATSPPPPAEDQEPPPVETPFLDSVLETGVWPPSVNEDITPSLKPLADNYLVVLDVSGSMGEVECSGGRNKLDAARIAVSDFVRSLPDGAQFGMLAFNHQVGELQAIAPADVTSTSRALDTLDAGGKTALTQALRDGWRVLSRQAIAQGGYGTYRMVVITDGYSSDGDPAPVARKIVDSSPVAINVIGFCLDGSHSLNVPGLTAYSVASNPEELARNLEKVKAEVPAFTATSLD
ncbi:MAG: vWA domain-containing protein [Magnetospiraceae bacterium]